MMERPRAVALFLYFRMPMESKGANRRLIDGLNLWQPITVV